MTSTLTAARPYHSGLFPPGVARLQWALLWLAGCGGAIVMIEPSPYEFATLAAIIFFFATGLRMRPVFLPLIVLLVVMNIGYTICAIYLMGDSKIVNWIITSWYMAITAIFFAVALADDTEARLDALRRGLIVGAVITSVAGIVGYFHLLPGAYDQFTLYGRLKGMFKDPNVLGAFLILPALFALQDVVTARFGRALRATAVFGIIALTILLAFSRASWGQLILTALSSPRSSPWRWRRWRSWCCCRSIPSTACSRNAPVSIKVTTPGVSAALDATRSASRWRSTCRSA
jgi:hypothetical protein